ncbi:hypothetical protein HY091_02050 [Candidatus Kaiserbacteria bacterium]|nr:hypothetical protein [Candidatus Kaiserbacteria bacterium]
MGYLIFLFVTIAFLAGFLALTSYEARRGMRVLASYRARLDEEAKRAAFVLTHRDLSRYLQDESKHLAERASHDLAHLFLQLVRGVERLLTRLVRHLRIRRELAPTSRENAREFVRTLADFKEQLHATHPEIPTVHEVK